MTKYSNKYLKKSFNVILNCIYLFQICLLFKKTKIKKNKQQQGHRAIAHDFDQNPLFMLANPKICTFRQEIVWEDIWKFERWLIT